MRVLLARGKHDGKPEIPARGAKSMMGLEIKIEKGSDRKELAR